MQPKNESMKKAVYLIIVLAVWVLNGCTSGDDSKVVTREEDSFYTRQAAMSIYAYQPVRHCKSSIQQSLRATSASGGLIYAGQESTA